MDPAQITFVDWRKSSRSSGSANCVEFATHGTTVGLRDSKNPAGPVLEFEANAWNDFVAGVKAGEFETQATA
jgi:Domain of unknown function (DUF397)